MFETVTLEAAVRVGKIVTVTPAGRVHVDFPGNSGGPREARTVIRISREELIRVRPGTPILLVFEDGDMSRPIVVGLIHDTLVAPNAEVKKKLLLEAEEEVSIRCGHSAVTLARNGKVVVRGRNLVSRSSGSNKIRGASVDIN
jgi:hypothetical protein